MVKLYIIGICILIIAILANALAIKIGLKSWYNFIELLNLSGKEALKQLNVLDYLWLFLGYPLVLGMGYLLGLKLYQLLF